METDAPEAESALETKSEHLLWIPAALGGAAIVIFVVLAGRRIGYPFELDWVESSMLETVRRVTHGQALYTPPSVEYVPSIYGPFNFLLAGALAKVLGVHYWVLRGISISASLGTLYLTYWLVRKETSRVVCGVIAAGLYAGTYRLTGTWFDIGKFDALFLFLTLASVVVARYGETKRAGVFAGALMALAYLTKQPALFVFAALAIFLVGTRPAMGWSFAATFVVIVGGVSLVWNLSSHGWYLFFLFQLPLQHDLIHTSKFAFISHDLRPLWPAFVVIAWALASVLTKQRLWRVGFYTATFAGLFIAAWSSRLHIGGAENVLMPAFLAIAIGLGLSLGAIIHEKEGFAVLVGATALCCLQFAFVRYSPGAQVPTAADKQVGEAFVSYLRTIPGDVLVFGHPTDAVYAGKGSYVSEQAAADVYRGKDPQQRAIFEQSFDNAIHQHRFAAIVLDSEGPGDDYAFPADWKLYYRKLSGKVVADDRLFQPVDFKRGHPRDIWVPTGATNISAPFPG